MSDTSSSVVDADLHDEFACPLSLTVDEVACMLNFELADHPVYDGGELQWFDDGVHGTGMLAFLSRRGSRRVDYYTDAGLRIDRAGYEIGGGTGSWTVTSFEAARLVVADDGVDAEVRFRDVDGRLVEIRVDDRDGGARHRAGLLAPVGAGIERPTSLLLVWMPRFDLVRVTSTPPSIRIEGRDAATGRLPGARFHRRHLIKYAAPVVVTEVNRGLAGRGETTGTRARAEVTGGRVTALTAERAGHRARLNFDAGLPDVAALREARAEAGRWHVEVDGVRLTGGTWGVSRSADQVVHRLDVDERWRPGPLPWLMRLVTVLVPVFRSWPTTYRWRSVTSLEAGSTTVSRWERTVADGGRSYRRATCS